MEIMKSHLKSYLRFQNLIPGFVEFVDPLSATVVEKNLLLSLLCIKSSSRSEEGQDEHQISP